MGAIFLGDTTLSAAAKKVLEKRVDCSIVLQKRPGAWDILEFLRGVP